MKSDNRGHVVVQNLREAAVAVKAGHCDQVLCDY